MLSDSPKEVTPIQVDVELLSWEKVSRNTTQGKKEEPNANKKRKFKRKAAAWIWKRVQASDLPSGWLLGRKVRNDGRGSRKYYIQPGTDIVFKSKKEAERFLKQMSGSNSATPSSSHHGFSLLQVCSKVTLDGTNYNV